MSTTATQKPPFPIDTIAEIERKNRRAGQHFFDSATLRFFNSRIQEFVVGHRFFVTTERHDWGGRRLATVRMIRDDGSIADVGEFQQFATPGAALKALNKALAAGVEIRNDPYEDALDPSDAKNFNWRPFLGDLPIGPRNTKWKARRLGAEAKRPAFCD